jgi:hypothetical protein
VAVKKCSLLLAVEGPVWPTAHCSRGSCEQQRLLHSIVYCQDCNTHSIGKQLVRTKCGSQPPSPSIAVHNMPACTGSTPVILRMLTRAHMGHTHICCASDGWGPLQAMVDIQCCVISVGFIVAEGWRVGRADSFQVPKRRSVESYSADSAYSIYLVTRTVLTRTTTTNF